jgi:ribosomal protein L40E
METIIIAVIAVVAIAAVALPLLRAGRSPHDAREYAAGPLTAPEATVPGAAPAAEVGSGLEAEIAQYREAIVAGTLCRKCGAPNGRDARFCLECGAKLPVEDAREFSA